MAEIFTCPICGQILEHVLWDPDAQYWIFEPTGDVVAITDCALIRVGPSPTPYTANPTEVLHSH